MGGVYTVRCEMDPARTRVDFEKPAILRKWPSVGNKRRLDGRSPYLLVEGKLDECIQELMAKPQSTRHLYDIYTEPQPPLVSDVLAGDQIAELARFKNYL
jgi:hypothetical protein